MNTHRIHRVAKLTGLSKDVIRVWERRFGLLNPTRGANRYRNYSDEDVALLRFLKEQLDAGGSIGELSKLGREELLGRARASAPHVSFVDNTFSRLLRELLSALNPFDRVIFEKRLNGAVAVGLGIARSRTHNHGSRAGRICYADPWDKLLRCTGSRGPDPAEVDGRCIHSLARLAVNPSGMSRHVT